MKRAVIYVRASLDRTGEGASVARQEEACRALAAYREWDVVAVKSDNSFSASNGKRRPAWQEVLRMIKLGEVDVVVAWHLDRITRTMVDLEELITLAADYNVGVATATGDIDLTNDVGRMVARILAAVARAEVERKAARQRLAYQQKARSGRPNWGTRPFGFEKDGSLRATEAAALAEAYRDVLNGSPLARCAQRLNDAGLYTTHGSPWSGKVLRGVLLNPRNIAKSTYRGEVVGDMSCDPIVPEDTFHAVKHLLNDPARSTGGGGVVRTLLSGIAECGRCGGTVKMGWKGRKGEPSAYQRYSCGKGHVTMPAEFVDSTVFLRLTTQDAEAWARGVFPEADPAAVHALTDEQAALTVRLEEAATAFADGALTMGQVTTMSERIRSRLAEIEDELASLGGAAEGFSIASNFEYLAQEFDQMPLDRQRALIAAVYSRVVLVPPGRGVTTTPEHVVTIRPDQTDIEVPQAVEKPDKYLTLAELLVTTQPPGVTSLRAAAEWLHDEGHTRLKPSGLRSRLWGYLSYDSAAGQWALRPRGAEASQDA